MQSKSRKVNFEKVRQDRDNYLKLDFGKRLIICYMVSNCILWQKHCQVFFAKDAICNHKIDDYLFKGQFRFNYPVFGITLGKGQGRQKLSDNNFFSFFFIFCFTFWSCSPLFSMLNQI